MVGDLGLDLPQQPGLEAEAFSHKVIVYYIE